MELNIHIEYDAMFDYCDAITNEKKLPLRIIKNRLIKTISDSKQSKIICGYTVFIGKDDAVNKTLMCFCEKQENQYSLLGVCDKEDYRDWMQHGAIAEWLNTRVGIE